MPPHLGHHAESSINTNSSPTKVTKMPRPMRMPLALSLKPCNRKINSELKLLDLSLNILIGEAKVSQGIIRLVSGFWLTEGHVSYGLSGIAGVTCLRTVSPALSSSRLRSLRQWGGATG